MSIVSAFGYTNTTASQNSLPSYDLKLVTNYAKVVDEPDTGIIANTTTPLDQGEWVTFRCNKINKINVPVGSIAYPAKNTTNNVSVVAKVNEVLRTTDSSTGEIICDEPIEAFITFRTPLSSHITDSVMTEVLKRLVGAVIREDGTLRFSDLVRSALIPSEN